MKDSEVIQKEKVVCLMSGGLDSFVSAFLLREDYDIYPLYVNYGHLAAENEYQALLNQGQILSLRQPHVVRIEGVSEMLKNNLTVPNIQINDFYPARNLMLLVFAAQYAYSLKINQVSIGVIRSLRQFSDTSIDYLTDLSNFISKSVNFDVKIMAPVSDLSKNDAISLLERNNFDLGLIYSCQKEIEVSISCCPSCTEMKNAIDWVNY